MKKLASLGALMALLILLFGCSKDNTSPVFTSDQDETVQTLKKSPKTKTLKIHNASGTMTAVYSEENDCYPEYAQMQIEGSGNATLLGNFTVVNTYCVFCDENGCYPASPIDGILTAANGDQIFTMVEDPANDIYLGEDGLFYFEYVILNGNGRFDDCTGDILMWGTIDAVSGTGTWELEGLGTITY